ncbi:hypothetical protein PanWU01x14_248850 [Parasponia andersonii]|uniref:Uncharacterized protein n=1 Tax=Parasponia andersonii TaxID=3476 RepID=A0A2P5BDC6_PARAD|nr:hypothetical protein PanWU01x14_248850 [Parasponia andersonii]
MSSPLLMLISKLTRSRPLSLNSLLRLLLLNHVYISVPMLMLIGELIMSSPSPLSLQPNPINIRSSRNHPSLKPNLVKIRSRTKVGGRETLGSKHLLF